MIDNDSELSDLLDLFVEDDGDTEWRSGFTEATPTVGKLSPRKKTSKASRKIVKKLTTGSIDCNTVVGMMDFHIKDVYMSRRQRAKLRFAFRS